MPPFSNPCWEFVVPYLQQHGDEEWKHACKLLLLSTAWQALIREWRMLVRDIVLRDSDSNALVAVRKYCPNLTSLALLQCNIDPPVLVMRLNEIAASCPRVVRFRLECTMFRLVPSFFHQNWTKIWSALTVFEISAAVATRLDNDDIAVWTARFQSLKTINISNTIWFDESQSSCTSRLISLFIEQQKSTLHILKLSKNIFPAVFDLEHRKNTTPLYTSIAACNHLKELHLPGLFSYFDDSSLKTILETCKEIKVLDLSETNISMASLQALVTLPSIERLCIHKTPLAKKITEDSNRGFVANGDCAQLMSVLREPWGILEFHRSNPNDANFRWLGPTNTDDNLAVPIHGYDFSVGRSRSNALHIGANWCVLLSCYSCLVLIYPHFVVHACQGQEKPLCVGAAHGHLSMDTMEKRQRFRNHFS